jgi:exonuclease SbcD
MLPFVKPAVVHSVFPDAEIHSYTDAVKIAVDAMNIDTNVRNVLVAHQFVTGASQSGSEELVIGGLDNVDSSVFAPFDYVALGHIHKPQDVNDSIRYCGTPMAYSFGKEETQEKSVTIVDTETMEHKIVPLHPLHKRTTLTGTLEELLHPEAEEDVINGYVKLKVTDKPVGLESLTQLKEIYPNLFECESRSFDSEGSTIKLTVEECEEMQTDPIKVFESFCQEMCEIEPTEHLKSLFENAVMMTEEAAK